MCLLCLGMANMNKIPSADRFRRRAGFLWSGEGLTGTLEVTIFNLYAIFNNFVNLAHNIVFYVCDMNDFLLVFHKFTFAR